jgi:hypothetical protein
MNAKAAGRRDVEARPQTGSVVAPKPVQVLVRMRETLKLALEDAADRKGVSTTAEIIDRLERSFADQERFGGPEMLAIVNLMVGSFMRGGQLAARASQHPEWTPAEWMNDVFCYRAAVHSVIDALAAAGPKLRWKEGISPEKQLEAERLHDFFAEIEQRHPGTIKRTGGEPKK